MFGSPGQTSPQEIVTTLAWLLAITVSATLYYHSRNLSRVLLYSGIALSVCMVILVTGQPPLPEAVYKTFSMLGIWPAALLLTVFAAIIGREVILRARHSRSFARVKTSSSHPVNDSDPYLHNDSENVEEILYHGTPTLENARDILRYGFLIGSGNSHGTGLYIADLETAKGYARGTGSIVQVRLKAPSDQVADHAFVNSTAFRHWCSVYGNENPGDNITGYALRVLKKRFLRVSDTFYVALANRTRKNERVIFEGVTILGILDAQGNPL